MRKIELGSTGCLTTVTDSCKSPDATCQSSGYCTCNSGYFDDNGSWAVGGICRQKIELGLTGCSKAVSDSCKSPHATCQSSGYCRCNNGYYDDNGSGAGGTCRQRKALGVQCSNIPNECADANAACMDDKCTCGDNHYDNNGFDAGGSCESVSDLKVTRITFQSVTTSGFKVLWTPPSGGQASHINMYKVEWSLKNSDNSLAGGNSEVSASTTSFDISTGVTAGKTYKVKVTSVNTKTMQGHTRTTFLTLEQASKPNKPRLLTTPDLDATDQQINIGWSVPSSGFALSYRVQLFDGTSPLTTNDTSKTSVNIYYQNMKNGYHYDVKISARSELYQGRQGSSYEESDFYVEQITTTVQVPNPPTEVKCDMLKDESITLKWLKPLVPNGDLKRFNIEVFNKSNDLLFSTNTAEVVETHQVMQLSPGTTYWFKVYTENVMYNSSVSAQSQYCTTKAKLSDPPDGFQTTEVTSRNISIKWTEPINSYSEEIYGYVIQLKNQDTCVEEIVYKCLTPSCFGTFEPSTLEDMCDSNVRKLFRVNKPELIGSKSYQFLNLLPDTTYTIIGAAVNNLGTGNTVQLDITTEEEAPQIPYNVEVNEMKTTSFKVTWNINDPRPGKTNYTVKLIAEHPAESKEVILTGFNIREYLAENLQEYWNYSVLVTATTSKGFKTSIETIKYRTLPTAPGKVSNFVLTPNPGGNYTRMKISWQAPDILLQNSVIKSYSFMYFQDQKIESRHSKSFEHELSQSHNYELFVDVIPEETYTFEVNAINEQNETGEKNSETKTAPAGVPINIAKTQNITLIPSDKVKNVGETRLTVSIVKEFFLEETYGKVQERGLFVCPKKDCSLKDTVTMLAHFDGMDSWKENKESYRVTNKTWFDDLEKSQTKSRRRRSVTELEYTVGVEDCSKLSTDKYCNGPLQPGSTYYIFCVSCTSGGCLVSDGNGPFITKAVPDEEANLGLIIGLVVAGVVIIVLIAVIAVLLLRRKRRHGDGMKPSPGEDDDDDFTKLDPATANIKRKRPINLNDIEEYVGNMHKDSNLLFSAEYEELKTLSPKHACEAADREENRMRNRYINIIPFDHSRVKLSTNGEDDSADYINGNYLPGYNSPREYIGCQGPIPGTIDDFWRMTWEQNVSVIVMLTLCKEGQKIKCEQYWPDEVGEPKQYGDVIVEITSYSNIRTYDYRMFRITNGSTTRVVKHFHFLSWLDFQANVHHDIILDFIQHVRQHVQPPDTSGPMIIHCSAGVGRTGTYIALDHLMQFINEHDFDVEIDIFDLVLKLRENRQHMVQTEQQYVFIHDCVKEIMERKRRQMENIYENQGFSQDENIYQNEQSLYANVSISKAEQNTEL
ncbi:tyrosine-protein phosphatase 10D-like [Ruditapes philippinarum]|uniref:tyrosine-protein phosphatase 10D-like n=1 Tax=Ruditapes philippinarum TaxID=129788 RepID=UPI00295C0E47|nr:tyrosine-protein phosphatase 10D-like [Ruditapes philippinarum]